MELTEYIESRLWRARLAALARRPAAKVACHHRRDMVFDLSGAAISKLGLRTLGR